MPKLMSFFADAKWVAVIYGSVCATVIVAMGFLGWNRYVKAVCLVMSVVLMGVASITGVCIFTSNMDNIGGNAELLKTFGIYAGCAAASGLTMYLTVNSKPGDMRIARALMKKRPVKPEKVPGKPGGFSIFDTGRDILYYGVASDMHKAVVGHLAGRGNQELYRGVQNGSAMEVRFYTLRRSGRGTISYLYRDLVMCMRQLRGTVDLNRG